MTNQEAAAYTLAALKKAGASDAQCFVTQGKKDEINVDSGKFSLMRSLFVSSLSMKALKDGKKGSIRINKLEKESIDAAVSECLATAESAETDEAEQIAPLTQNAAFRAGVLEPDRNGLFDRIEEYMAEVATSYPKVMIEQLVADYSRRTTLYCNSNGAEFSYEHGAYQFSSTFSAQEGGQTSSSGGSGCAVDTLDIPFIEIGLQKQQLEDCEKQIVTVPFEGKQLGTIVLMPDCLAEFLEMSFDSFLRDAALIDATSPWKDSLGKQVAHEQLSVSANPLDARVVCGERFTGDGYASEDMEIIKNGVLQTFLLSQYGANKTGHARAKNTGAHLFVTPGEQALGEIIADIDRGLIVGRFSGGQPGTNGDFSGVAKNSFLIENGRVTDAVSETMISGNLAQLLQDLVAVSRETVQDGVNVLPYAAFRGVTISGK